MSLKTALKIKNVRFSDPANNPCGDYGPETHLRIKKDQLPLQRELIITYYQPIKRQLFFSNHFNLGLRPESLPLQTDNYYEFGLTRLQINQRPNRDGNQLEIVFPHFLPEGSRFSSKKSTVRFLSPTGMPVLFKEAKLEESFANKSDGFLKIEASPLIKENWPYLIAEVNLHLLKDGTDTESFEFPVQSAKDNPIINIDGYSVQIQQHDQGFIFVTQEGSHYNSGGIPGRTIKEVVISSANQADTLKGNHLLSLKGHNYPLTVRVNTYKVQGETVLIKKKVALGAIYNMNQPNQARQFNSKNSTPETKEKQNVSNNPKDSNEPVRSADNRPLFPGCEEKDADFNLQDRCSVQSLTDYIYQHPVYLANKSTVGNNQIILKFVVEKDGTLSQYEIMRSNSAKQSEAAIQIFKELKGKWTPATINGQPVRFSYVLPIKF